MENELIAALISIVGGSGLIGGILLALFKRQLARRDSDRAAKEMEREQKDQKIEDLMLLMMRENHATYILVEATAKAVQRIPDAKCNGDMKQALKDAAACQKDEKNFLVDQGIEHIFK